MTLLPPVPSPQSQSILSIHAAATIAGELPSSTNVSADHPRCRFFSFRPLPSCLPLQASQEYYGTGESFVYSFHPTFKTHRWTGANDYFCISSESWLAMGGGGGGFAFQIDDELDAGESNPSETFGSPRLSSNEFFRCMMDLGA